MPLLGIRPNITSDITEQHNSVYTNEEGGFEKSGHTVTITVSAVIATAIFVLSALLCYREVNRRRKMSDLTEEMARRASIKLAIRHKLLELEQEDDHASNLEQAELKAPLVTFSDVTTVSDIDSPIKSHVFQHESVRENHYSEQDHYQTPHEPRFYRDSKRQFNHIPYQHNHSQSRILQRPSLQNHDHSLLHKSDTYNNHHHKLQLPRVHMRDNIKDDSTKQIPNGVKNNSQTNNCTAPENSKKYCIYSYSQKKVIPDSEYSDIKTAEPSRDGYSLEDTV